MGWGASRHDLAAIHARLYSVFLRSPQRFDMVVTSPAYGNRMADHHNAQDGSKRSTYRVGLGTELDDHNSGRMQWGSEYQKLHRMVWYACWRVLRPGGWMLLNCKDHIRAGERAAVTAWHINYLQSIGFVLGSIAAVATPSMRFGSNSDKRVGDGELIVAFRKGLV